MDDMRMRLDRVRGRLPIDAEPMQIFRQDSNAMPIMSLGIEGNYDRVTLREMAENQLGPRLERVEGVAAVTTMGGLAPPDSRPVVEGKDRLARPAGRARHGVASLGKPEHAARRSQPGRADVPPAQPGRSSRASTKSAISC